jgi:hypothetical protein
MCLKTGNNPENGCRPASSPEHIRVVEGPSKDAETAVVRQILYTGFGQSNCLKWEAFMAETVVKLRLNQQQLELMDRTIAQGVAPDRVSLVRLALREYAAAHKADGSKETSKETFKETSR